MQDFVPFGGTPYIGSTQPPVLAVAAEEELVLVFAAEEEETALEELLTPGAGVGLLPVQTGWPPVVLKFCPAQDGM